MARHYLLSKLSVLWILECVQLEPVLDDIEMFKNSDEQKSDT